MYLELFGMPEAMEAGATMLVGFADQFLPVIIGSTITPLLTRFLLGCINILQILYMAGVGALILTSKMPFKLWQMFVIFLERVLLCIPIVILCAHLFGIA